jgi:hypothetical protein
MGMHQGENRGGGLTAQLELAADLQVHWRENTIGVNALILARELAL